MDLVQWQLRIASGEKLNIKQKDIKREGCAIECRINAEDPANNFTPCPGPIDRYVAPGGIGVRIDSHVFGGYKISPYYDSLIAKLIVHRKTRAEAIACMKRALAEYDIAPIKTSIPLCLDILNHPDYVNGKVNTGFIEKKLY